MPRSRIQSKNPKSSRSSQTVACEFCRRRKERCEGSPCLRCIKHNQVCVFPSTDRSARRRVGQPSVPSSATPQPRSAHTHAHSPSPSPSESSSVGFDDMEYSSKSSRRTSSARRPSLRGPLNPAACKACQHAHKKCTGDGTKPCSTCLNRRITCEYDDRVRNRLSISSALTLPEATPQPHPKTSATASSSWDDQDYLAPGATRRPPAGPKYPYPVHDADDDTGDEEERELWHLDEQIEDEGSYYSYGNDDADGISVDEDSPPLAHDRAWAEQDYSDHDSGSSSSSDSEIDSFDVNSQPVNWHHRFRHLTASIPIPTRRSFSFPQSVEVPPHHRMSSSSSPPTLLHHAQSLPTFSCRLPVSDIRSQLSPMDLDTDQEMAFP